MAVERTPERSLSDLLSNSRAALATTGWTPAAPRWRVFIIALRVVSIWREGSARKWRPRPGSCRPRHKAHAESRPPRGHGWSSPNGCASPAPLPDRPAHLRCSGRRGLPTRRVGLPARGCSGACRVGRIEQDHAAEAGPPACGQRPVFALDVVDDGRTWPGQERGHHQAHALAAAGGCKAQDMLRAVVTEIALLPAPRMTPLPARRLAFSTSELSAQRADP